MKQPADRLEELAELEVQRHLEARYLALVQSVAQIVWCTPPSGELTTEQPGWSAFTGQSFDQYRGWGWLTAVHPDDRRRIRQLWERALETGTALRTDYRLRRHDGAYRWIAARGAPVLDENARVREWIATHADVDEAKRATEERRRLYDAERAARLEAERATQRLRDAQEISDAASSERELGEMLHTLADRLRAALRGDTATILLLSDDGLELVVAATIGLAPDIVEGMRVGLGPRDGFAGRVAEARRPLAVGDAPTDLASNAHVRDRLRAMAGAPLLASGRLVGVLYVGSAAPRDFSVDDVRLLQLVADRAAHVVDRARLLESERRARGEAEAANRAKMDFLAVMSHELRTPLNAIAGYAELLEMGLRGPLTEAQRTDLAAIRRNERLLIGLIEQVLSFAKLDAGRLQLDITEIRLQPSVESAIAIVEAPLRERKLALTVETQDPALRVTADEEQLQQIIINLLSNAAKFTPSGGTVTVRSVTDSTTARISVSDSGIGIPEDQLERIFEPFVQLSGRFTRKAVGTGLGLAISRQLARAMGGDLVARSRVGSGAEFTLLLPRAPG